METELLEQFKTMNDSAPATAATDFGAAKLHGEHAIALEAHVANLDLLAGLLLARGGFDDRRTGAATKQQRGGVALGIAADQQHALALLRHHVRQVGEREALAAAALAIDGDDLRVFGRRGRGHRIRLLRRLRAQLTQARILHIRDRDGCDSTATHAGFSTRESFSGNRDR